MECMTERPVRPHGGAALAGRAFDVEAFRSLDFARREDDAIWTHEWVCIGSVADIPGVGDLLPFTVGDHAIHMQRMPGGELAGRFNKAQHGGCRVVPLQCRQGAKTPCSFTSCGHSLDRPAIPAGELDVGAPAMYQYLGLRPERLLPVRIATLGPLLFANLDPGGEPFDTTASAVRQALPALAGEDWREPQQQWHACDANWKLAGQHLVGASPSAPLSGNDVLLVQTDDGGTHALWLFPNLVVLATAASLCVVVLQATALTRTLCRVVTFARGDRAPAPWDVLLAARLGAAARAQAAMEGGGIRGRGSDPAQHLDPGGRWLEAQVLARMAAHDAASPMDRQGEPRT
jgi:hypothetical protein